MRPEAWRVVPATGAGRSVAREGQRDAALDLLKWLALLGMLLDHLRHVWQQAIWVFVPGRTAFPFFCLIVAANLARRRRQPQRRSAQMRYLGWLLLFALFSEWPYRLLVEYPASVNVLPTLALGLLLANAALQPYLPERLLGLAALALALWFDEELMFGAFGVLLPAAFVFALDRRPRAWLLPAGVAVAANADGFSAVRMFGPLFVALVYGACFAAPLFGLWLLRRSPAFPVAPLRRWAYAFYPGHFLMLYGLREWLFGS